MRLKEPLASYVRRLTPGSDDDIDIEHCQDILSALQQINMDINILQETKIGKIVVKFRKHRVLGPVARALIKQWKQLVDMSQLLEASVSSTMLKSISTVQALQTSLDEQLSFLHSSDESQQSKYDVDICQKILSVLNDIKMNSVILEVTRIGKTVHKLRHHDILGSAASALVVKWKEVYFDQNKSGEGGIDPRDPSYAVRRQCTGRAAEALEAFRRRKAQLKAEGCLHADMIAYKELRPIYLPKRKAHGEIEGVPIGLVLNGRGEAAILGIHASFLSGIDAKQDESCYAVCMSSRYLDNDINADGTILYTGSGGQDKNGRQVMDQDENVGNASLLRSISTGLPIRVLRALAPRDNGNSHEYCYVGLYKCTGYVYELSLEGPCVYKFTLAPVKTCCKKQTIPAP